MHHFEKTTFEKGTQMSHAKHLAKKPSSPEAGFFATLRGRLHVPGSGARSHGPVPAPNPKRVSLALASLLACGIVMALFASPVLAKQGRVFTGSFGSAFSTPADPYPLSNPGPIAVSSSGASAGDVYVPQGSLVEKFDSAGQFILMFGKEVNKTKVKEAGSTEAERDVCTAVSGDECQNGTERIGGYIAVDNSTGPSSGDVYVAEGGVVSKFDEEGILISSWGASGRLNGSSAGPFETVHGVAVDSFGNLWVYGTHKLAGGETRPRVFEFKQDSSFITDWSFDEYNPGNGIAVDAEDNVYLNIENVSIFKFSSSGTEIGYIIDESGAQPTALAVDPSTDELYVGVQYGGGGVSDFHILRYAPACKKGPFEGCVPVESFSSSNLREANGFAINPSSPGDTIYAAEQAKGEVATVSVATLPDVATEPASGFTSTSATINGTVNPEGLTVSECFFEWGEGSGAYEHIASCEAPGAAEIGSGTEPVAVHARISVQYGKTYHFRLVAANANDVHEPVEGSDVVFGPPRVDSSSITEITSSSVTFQAQVDPQNAFTEYHFEYLTEAEFNEDGKGFSGLHSAIQVPLSDAKLGSGQVDLVASQHVQGLLAHTGYRFRVVARSLLAEGVEAVDGPVESFMTWGTGGFVLPDGRAWEMVSPPDLHGALVEPIGEDWLIQAAADGGALAYVARTPTESNPAGFLLYQSVLATRGGGGGWSSRDLSIPHVAATDISVGEGWEYRFFSEDLSRAVVQPFGAFVPCESALGVAQPCLSPEASEQTAFLAANGGGGGLGEPCTVSCYTPLVTGAEGYANVPPHTVFGQISTYGKGCPPNEYCGPKFLDATPDASHVVLRSYVALTASPALGHNITQNSLYEWSEGEPAADQLRLVNVLPGNEQGEALPSSEEPLFGFHEDNIRHAISNDGARVVWGTGHHLYLRENATQSQSRLSANGKCLVAADACTVQLDVGLSGTPKFQTANSEDTRIFFTDSGDLYEYNVEEGKLVALTTGAGVIGSVIGASEDGSWIYFVANGALASGAVDGTCSNSGSIARDCNLYVMHHDGMGWEAPRLVAVISDADGTDWSGVLEEYPGLTARVSPNGEWLAFVSERSLTGYDNFDAVSDEPDDEVYEYGAAAGELVCASCNPTGSRPHGMSSEQISTANGGIIGGDQVYSGWVAADLPPWTPTSLGAAIYQSRYLDNSGRLFFDSSDALVPKDINKTGDVYEYEPEGVPAGEHACSSASQSGSVVFRPARSVEVEGRLVDEGASCVGLISSGESPQESAFLDASETGSEVFFLTSAKLTPEDINTSPVVYDARECTTQSPCLPPEAAAPPACETEASCKPAPSPQPEIFGPSGSSTFSGQGNLLSSIPEPVVVKPPTRAQKRTAAHGACKKDKRKKKRAACEKQARKKHGARAKAVKASNDRRAGR